MKSKSNMLAGVRKSYRKKWKYVLAIIPSTFFYLLFCIYPNLAVFPMSLFDWSPIRKTRLFVGLKNFRMMFTVNLDGTISSLQNTLLYMLFLFAIQTVLSLILAVTLQKNTHRNKFFRAFFFLPLVFSSTMVSMTWAFMYDPNLGIINTILGKLGVAGYPGTNFFSPDWRAVLMIVIVHIWANMGYPITILTSGLSSISAEMSEAALVDGANEWQTFTKITFPVMLPTILRLALLTFVTGASAVDYCVMLGSKTMGATYDTWAVSMYKGTLSSTDYGGISAMAVIMFLVLGSLTLIQFITMRKVEDRILG